MLKRAVDTEKAKLKRIRDAFEAGIDTIDEFRENKARIAGNIAELEAELKKAEETKKPKFSKKEFGKKVSDVLNTVNDESADISAKNAALRTIIHHIDFCKPQNEFKIFFYI